MDAEHAFGEVLRELRLAKQLSQEALALEADLQRNYISLLELGSNSATIKTLFKLAPVLGLSPAQMLALTEERMQKGAAGAGRKRK